MKTRNYVTPKNYGKSIFSVFAIMLLGLFIANCAGDDITDDSTDDSSNTTATTVSITDTSATGTAEGGTQDGANSDDLLANSSFESIITVAYSGTSATVTGTVSGVTTTVSGADVTITSSAKGVQYVLSGTTTAGSFKLYSEKKTQITLNGVNITNASGPAINVQPYNDDSGRIFVVLNSGTTNTLTDGTSYSTPSTEDAKGTIFAEGKLIFSGTGSLTVNGKYKHGIVSDDYVRIVEGAITIASAVSDGIHANDAFIMDGGTLKISATSDGIDAEEGYVVINDGAITINAGDDGIAASYDLTETGADQTITPYVTINGGTFVINTTEGEGIESKSILTVNGGTFTINTYDDGLNAASGIYFNGGKMYVKSSTNDAVDSNGTLTVTGGTIVAIGATAPEGAFDSDQSTFKITGGTLMGIGGATSTPTASTSSQNSVILGATGTSGKILHIQSSDGTEALTFLVPQSYTTMLYSSSKIATGTTYNVYTGGSVSSGTDFNGLYTSGTYSGGTKSSVSFTASSRVANLGGNTGPGGR